MMAGVPYSPLEMTQYIVQPESFLLTQLDSYSDLKIFFTSVY